MTQAQWEILLLASVTAMACSLPGVFLILRRMTLLSDAISHTVLLGIVLAFFLTGSLTSPLLIAGAALMGVVTVLLVEGLQKSSLVREDAAIGLVFPALFSTAVLLISLFGKNVHLDTDAVLLGKIAFAPLPGKRLELGGWDLGPKSTLIMAAIFLVNILFIALFYKELKITTFDPPFARSLGILPWVMHLGLVLLVSVTSVAAFDAVGSILVVALMSAPAAGAYLLTDRLGRMLFIAPILSLISAGAGYFLSRFLDCSISGAMAVAAGGVFLLAFLFSKRGLFAHLREQKLGRDYLQQTMLAVHLFQHEGSPQEEIECKEETLHDHLQWSAEKTRKVINQALQTGLVTRNKNLLQLRSEGRKIAQEVLQPGQTAFTPGPVS